MSTTALDFISQEARLLDERRYEAWIDLFTEDSRYWAPYEWGAVEPRNSLNIIYDDLPRLKDRVSRLMGGDLHAQDPASHTQRILGLPREAELSWQPGDGTETVVCVPFHLGELRREVITPYYGVATYWLVPHGDTWKIRAKKVQLLGAESPLGNLTFLL